MLITVDFVSETPIYIQIYEQIVSQILTGKLESDFCLPSIRTIAKELGISIITIKKAWEMLEKSNFIYTKAGIGCFVKEHADKHLNDKKIRIAEEKLKTDIEYYKSLKINLNELIELIKRIY